MLLSQSFCVEANWFWRQWWSSHISVLASLVLGLALCQADPGFALHLTWEWQDSNLYHMVIPWMSYLWILMLVVLCFHFGSYHVCVIEFTLVNGQIDTSCCHWWRFDLGAADDLKETSWQFPVSVIRYSGKKQPTVMSSGVNKRYDETERSLIDNLMKHRKIHQKNSQQDSCLTSNKKTFQGYSKLFQKFIWWHHLKLTAKLGGGFKYCLFSPRSLGKWNPIWRAYFSKGLIQPPTSQPLMPYPLKITWVLLGISVYPLLKGSCPVGLFPDGTNSKIIPPDRPSHSCGFGIGHLFGYSNTHLGGVCREFPVPTGVGTGLFNQCIYIYIVIYQFYMKGC